MLTKNRIILDKTVLIVMHGGKTATIDREDICKVPGAWHLSADGYPIRTGMKHGELKTMRLAREIMNAQPGQIVKHLNGNRCDCRKENLILTTRRKRNHDLLRHEVGSVRLLGQFAMGSC